MKMSALAFFVASSLLSLNAALAAPSLLTSGDLALQFDEQGCPAILTIGSETLSADCSAGAGRVDLGAVSYRLEKPASIRSSDTSVGVAYRLTTNPELIVSIGYQFVDQAGVMSLARHVDVQRLDGLKALPADLTIQIFHGVLYPRPTGTWIPLKNGTGPRIDLSKSEVIYRAAGKTTSMGLELALPLFVPELPLSSRTPIALFADPSFSIAFDAASARWTYAKEVGLEDGVETRTLFATLLSPENDIHKLSDKAIDAFYSLALTDVPPGPTWLRTIAMVGYDYMSDGGRGWKNDIDILTLSIPPDKRKQVMLTLHGWFDFNGRFSFTPGRAQLDASWPSFRPQVARLDVSEIRRRIKYAKDRGFKVAIYYANGMNSASHPRVEIARNPDHILRRLKNGWSGPDMGGSQAVVLNPSHPEVFNHFVQLAKAELNAFGDLLDAYVWDETFYVQAGDLGTQRVPGYVDRAFMRLTKAIARTIHARNPQAAFLTSDDIGLAANVPPYALFADGTYQDARVTPVAWSFALFPNYRNAVFSCNWFTKTRFSQLEFGVRNYQAPVAISNGWADDYGFSEMTAAERKRYLDLFDWRSRFATDLQWKDQLAP